MLIQRFLYLPAAGWRAPLQQALADYAASLAAAGRPSSLGVRILTGEPWFSLSLEHNSLTAFESAEQRYDADDNLKARAGEVDKFAASTLQDLWEVLVAPQPVSEVNYIQLVRHTPAPGKAAELKELLVERAGLIAASPGVAGSALHEQFLPQHGITAFATVSLFSDLAGMGADHVALPANPAFIANAARAAAVSAGPFDRQVFQVL